MLVFVKTRLEPGIEILKRPEPTITHDGLQRIGCKATRRAGSPSALLAGTIVGGLSESSRLPGYYVTKLPQFCLTFFPRFAFGGALRSEIACARCSRCR